MKKDIHLLIIDDDAGMCRNLDDILSEEGYKITSVGTVALAKKELTKKSYNIVLIDLKLPDGSGLELLKEIKKMDKEIIVIIFTGFASLESAVSAMNEGAFAYIQKPFNIDEMKITIKRAIKMQELSLENKNLLNRLQNLSLKDPLTGLYNYRYLTERLTSEFKRAKRYILPLSILMIDLDYFRSVNDVYGHRYGDGILKEMGRYLINFSRGNDIVVRYGGEEFIILLLDTYNEGAVKFGKRLLEAINEHTFDSKGKKLKLKISIGITSFPENGVNAESGLLDSAEQALRDAKEMGGDRLSVFKGISKEDMETIAERGGKENVDKLKEKLFKLENRINQTLLESIYAFAKTIEAKDYYTGEHVENMVSIATEIGKKLNLSGKKIELLQHAAVLHDLGKVGIPDKILLKRKKLTQKEYEEIKKHPQIGAEILRPIHSLFEVIPIILYHHERFDGLGYPTGLKGEEIPLGARIIAVADVYQALISDRPYRKAYSKEEALKIIREGSGTQFDPEIVKAFLATV